MAETRNPFYREDENGKTVKVYISEVEKEELEQVKRNIASVREDIRREVEVFVDECIRVFEERKRKGASADRYDREQLGVMTSVREQKRCCVVYVPYVLLGYFDETDNVFLETKSRLDRQAIQAFR